MQRNKHQMQENLKKVFMRSVCALNFEAMSIMDPADQNSAAGLMQKELEKQVQHAMDYGNDTDTKSELSFTLSEKAENHPPNVDDASREMMNMALAMQEQEKALDPNTRRIESKDAMWKPAPIVGREPTAFRYGT